jgi:hypothetical protein
MTATTQKEVNLSDEIDMADSGLAAAVFHAKDQTN